MAQDCVHQTIANSIWVKPDLSTDSGLSPAVGPALKTPAALTRHTRSEPSARLAVPGRERHRRGLLHRPERHDRPRVLHSFDPTYPPKHDVVE